LTGDRGHHPDDLHHRERQDGPDYLADQVPHVVVAAASCLDLAEVLLEHRREQLAARQRTYQ